MSTTRRLIIHAGMHKTGSTSIQHWLQNAKLEDAHYFDWIQANHSTFHTLLFEDKPYEYFGLKRKGYTAENTLKRRRKARKALIDQIENIDVSTFVFSAERISSAPADSVVQLARFFAKHFDQIDVYGYVRQPTGFMTSMFQQHLKTWVPNLTVRQLWPEYQRRFARIDRAFGKENVHLRRYEDLRVKGTDAVEDFLDWSGLKGTGELAVRRNTSMRSDAVALLYVYRKYVVPQMNDTIKTRVDAHVVTEIAKVGGDRFILNLPADPDFDRKRRNGMQWMSDRMGIEINDLDEDKADTIIYRSDTDLTRAAVAASHKLARGSAVLDPDADGTFNETLGRLRAIAQRDLDG